MAKIERRPKLTPEQLGHDRVVESFRALLRRHLPDRSLTDTKRDPRRRLAIDDYFSLVRFGLFNPVVRSLRGLSAASHLKVVQERVCSHPVSLGSFSEAQHLFGPEVWLQALRDCAGRFQRQLTHDPRLAGQLKLLQAHDSTVIRALPRMAWALWMDEANRGVRVHLDSEVFRIARRRDYLKGSGVELGLKSSVRGALQLRANSVYRSLHICKWETHAA